MTRLTGVEFLPSIAHSKEENSIIVERDNKDVTRHHHHLRTYVYEIKNVMDIGVDCLPGVIV